VRFLKSTGASRKLDALRNNGWLAEQPAEFKELLLSRSRLMQFEKNETIYSAGDPPGGPYGLVRGAIRIELWVSDSGSHVAHLAAPGFWVGEMAALRHKPRAVTVTAAKECVLAHLPLAQFEALALDPGFVRRFAELSAENTALALQVIRDLLTPEIGGRVASKLQTLARFQRQSGCNEVAARSISVTQSDLAMMCSISRKCLNHHLARLQQDGVIVTGYGVIQILDRERLSRLAEGQGR
jgi:CRP-like cAMP-binding protein